MLLDVGGFEIASVLDVQSLFFFIKENWLCTINRYHDEPNINILLTRNLSDSYIRQWSHPLVIPLQFLWTKLNKRTRGQFECDMTLFCFCFDLFLCTVSFGEGGLFEIGHPRPREWKKFRRRWTEGVGGLENWTILVDVIFVSFHRRYTIQVLKSYPSVK